MKRNWWLVLAAVLFLFSASGAIVACGDDDDDDDDDTTDDDVADDDADDDAADDDADDDMDDDMDDDIDDDADDDSGDDDECETTEVDICDWLVNDCADMYGLGTTDFCESVYEEDCAIGSIGDVDGFITCVCNCMAADPTCTDQSAAAAAETWCFDNYCGTI